MSLNAYKLLRELIPEAPLLVGDVELVTNGVATIITPGGGKMNARCEASIVPGQRVYFRGGAVEGVAPALPIQLVEI